MFLALVFHAAGLYEASVAESTCVSMYANCRCQCMHTLAIFVFVDSEEVCFCGATIFLDPYTPVNKTVPMSSENTIVNNIRPPNIPERKAFKQKNNPKP